VPDSRRGSQRWSWFRAARVSRAAQQESGSRAGELLISLLDEAGRAEVDTLLARGKYVYAVRRVRELTGLRLADAKRLVDTLEWKSGRRLRPPGGGQLPAWFKGLMAAFQEVGQHRWLRLPVVSMPPIAADSGTVGQVPSRPSSRVRSPGRSTAAVALRSQTALTGSGRPG
jgi:hypothetical protein